jgi:hypothetical protein
VEGVLAQFLDVSRKFTATLQDMRKQELMHSRGSNPRKSLALDNSRLPSRGRPQQFMPQRKTRRRSKMRDMIAASPDYCEFEWDSMTSQSLRTAHTCLKDKFVVAGTKLLAKHTPDQIKKLLVAHVQQELAIAGGVDDRSVKDTNFGGF